MPANDDWKEYESRRHHDALPRLRKAETADTRCLNQKIQYIADVLYFFIVSALRRDLRVGADLREQNALPNKTWKNAEFVGKARR